MRTLAATASVLVTLIVQAAVTPAAGVLGTWRGTSICVDPAVDQACRNEGVVYVIDSATSPRGPVRMRADKVVSGVRQQMGVGRLTYDSTTHAWFTEFTARFHARWSFTPHGDVMVGALRELPTGRLVRRVNVRRVSQG